MQNGEHHQPGHNRNLYQHLKMISNLNNIDTNNNTSVIIVFYHLLFLNFTKLNILSGIDLFNDF